MTLLSINSISQQHLKGFSRLPMLWPCLCLVMLTVQLSFKSTSDEVSFSLYYFYNSCVCFTNYLTRMSIWQFTSLYFCLCRKLLKIPLYILFCHTYWNCNRPFWYRFIQALSLVCRFTPGRNVWAVVECKIIVSCHVLIGCGSAAGCRLDRFCWALPDRLWHKQLVLWSHDWFSRQFGRAYKIGIKNVWK